MDKNMILFFNIWRHFLKESLCNCFSMLYICLRKRTRHGTTDSASIEWVYRRNFEWKIRCL